jgi:hypothetical protein
LQFAFPQLHAIAIAAAPSQVIVRHLASG